MQSEFRTMMKVFVLVLLSVVVVVTAEEKYTTKYDDIDLDAILNNERLLKQYHECLMDRGKCTKEGEELKSKFYFEFIVIIVSICRNHDILDLVMKKRTWNCGFTTATVKR